MAATKVGMHELRNRLGKYLRQVKTGETIIVTERGKTIGLIIPARSIIDEELQAVVDSGLADWNGGIVKPGQPVAIDHGKKQVSDLVAENRDVNDAT